MRTIGLGLGLTLVVTALLAWIRDPTVVQGAVSAGMLATLIQFVSTRKLHRSLQGTNAEFFTAVGAGLALRLAGVAVLAVATVIAPERFPPAPTAFGFLGVLIPLLFLEVYRIR